MNNFIMTVGVSYLPLHEDTQKVAQKVGKVEVFTGKNLCETNVAKNIIKMKLIKEDWGSNANM